MIKSILNHRLSSLIFKWCNEPISCIIDVEVNPFNERIISLCCILHSFLWLNVCKKESCYIFILLMIFVGHGYYIGKILWKHDFSFKKKRQDLTHWVSVGWLHLICMFFFQGRITNFGPQRRVYSRSNLKQLHQEPVLRDTVERSRQISKNNY